MEMPEAFGATPVHERVVVPVHERVVVPVHERVVVDGNVITGGGATAGIDFGLRVIGEVKGRAVAAATQLGVEYDPNPPFDAGSPKTADSSLVAQVREAAAGLQSEIAELVKQAATALP